MLDLDPHRLPRAVLPQRYDVVLRPDLPAATFTGSVAIAVEVTEVVEAIVANSLELEITDAVLRSAEGTVQALVTTLDPITERVSWSAGAAIAPGSYVLSCSFTGILNDKLRGFYRSTYTAADGSIEVIATTQMQSTDCRRAFPCFDEPDMKAVFGITLEVPSDLLAISNGAEIGRDPIDGGLVRVRFADTMVMSTYLVAFVVGRLEVTGPVDVDGVPLRIVHVPGKGHLTGLALDCAAGALRFFQQYYAIPYPAEKVDLVALPDFAAGAMENLGCITFRETLLLADPATATQAEAQNVVDVVAHELAHMWFGDLVTMRWWNGIWLNEAFATFMEVLACDELEPEWKRWDAFSLERTVALDVDALATTRPVELAVGAPAEAAGMFDVLTYQKGGALLRMLEQYLGADRFRDGIRRYLSTHAYGNTETDDLWSALEAETGEPVRRIMDSWIFQGGFPVIRAEIVGDQLRLTQRRFRLDGESGDEHWVVPVLVRQADDHEDAPVAVLVEAGGATVAVRPSAPVVVNAGGHGFYRTSLSPELLARLTGPVLSRLSTVERYLLVDDAFAAAYTGDIDLDAVLDLVRAFGDESALAVWQVLIGHLRFVDRIVEGDARAGFRADVRALVGPALHRLGWDVRTDDDDLTRELRGLLVRTLAVLGDDHVAAARARELHGTPGLDASLAAACLSVVASTGDGATWDEIVAAFRSAPTPQEQLRSLYALAELPGRDEMERTLGFVIDGGEVRAQNAPYVLNRCIGHRDHGRMAFDAVARSWATLVERYPEPSISRMVENVRVLLRPEDEHVAAGFFAEHPIPQASRTLEQILERQRINVAFAERVRPALHARLGR